MGDTRGTAAQQSARAVTDLVGDGCVVRLLDPRRRTLRAVAVDHRDAERRSELAALLSEDPLPLAAGWTGQALAKNLAFRVDRTAASEAALGDQHAAETGHLIHGAIVAPLRQGGRAAGVVVALRDSVDLPYTLRDQRLVEELAASQEADPAPQATGHGERAIASPAAPERVLEHAASGVWVTDRDGITNYVNAALCELVGMPSVALVGRPMASFLDEEPGIFHSDLATMAERRDHRLLRGDGSEVWVCVTSNPLTDDDGRRQGTVSTLTDVTERKRVEVELRMRAAAHEAVAELAERALGGASVEALMQGAVAAAADILAAEYACVSEVSSDGQAVIPRALFGWADSLIGQRLTIPEQSPAWLALEAEDPVLVEDYAEIDRLELGPHGRAAAVRSTAIVAVAGGTALLGVASPRAGAFSSGDLPFLRSLADLLTSRSPAAPRRPAAVPAY